MQIINENPIHLIADEGMALTNGTSYSTEIWLSVYDSPSNWREIPENEVPENPSEEESLEELAEAARILLGVSK